MQDLAAVKFFDKVAEVAEEEGHHPDLHLTDYREVKVSLCCLTAQSCIISCSYTGKFAWPTDKANLKKSHS